jgi:hypothetical protein
MKYYLFLIRKLTHTFEMLCFFYKTATFGNWKTDRVTSITHFLPKYLFSRYICHFLTNIYRVKQDILMFDWKWDFVLTLMLNIVEYISYSVTMTSGTLWRIRLNRRLGQGGTFFRENSCSAKMLTYFRLCIRMLLWVLSNCRNFLKQ